MSHKPFGKKQRNGRPGEVYRRGALEYGYKNDPAQIRSRAAAMKSAR
jgi:hypothetical protein